MHRHMICIFCLQTAKTRQKIKEEEMQVKVIERTQQIQLQVDIDFVLLFIKIVFLHA